MSISNLLFLTNDLQNPRIIHEMKVPMHFITFAICDAQMYKHERSDKTFTLPLTHGTRRWGNSVVYGALFTLEDENFYIRLLDAYHSCSRSTLGINHKRDLHHRVDVDIRPIRFASLDELERLQYTEGDSLRAQTYMGNINHPKINQRFASTRSFRVIDGVDITHFLTLYKEVTHGTNV